MKKHFDRIDRLPPYVFNVIGELKMQARAAGEDIIDFSMGNPDSATPEHIINKLVETAANPQTHRYSSSKGIERLRLAMAEWYQRQYQVELNHDSEVIVTIGSKEGIAHLALATLQRGDTVLVPSPAYPIHPYGVVIAGADVRHVPLSENINAFIDSLEEAIANSWPRPKMLILNFPANPSTQCVELDFFQRIVDLAKAHEIWIVHDLAYAELVYDGYRAPSILQIPGAKDIAVEFYSLSKSYNMAGWRVGFCCGNPILIGALTKLKSYLDYGIFTPIQVAAIEALSGPQDCVEDIRQMYQKRRNVLYEGLNQIGWSVPLPKATMFVWAKIPDAFNHMGSLDFAKQLLKETNVAVSPGIGFGQYSDNYVRFALIENEQRTRQALKNIKSMLKNNKRTKSNVFNIEYVSTRSDNDKQEKYTFEQVVLEGLARDGGLFIPKVIPNVQERFQRWKMLSYQQLAFEIFQLFTGESIPKDDLRELVQNSYNTFSHPDITPITHTKQVSLVELYHGPTHAFKDVALQFLGNLFSYFLRKNQRQLNILGATSGDTGSAAITGVRGKTGINIFMLHPKDKISKVQEQQMTTVLDENVFNIAIDGTFDDCQNIVKALFSDLDFKDKLQLGAVNSINWARILSQVVYYFYATLRFQEANPKKPVIFSVPTGNFGDIYAGYIATKMGLPINKLIIATNENNILERTLKTGCYKVTEVQATLSPAMDIQVSSNFERFLYDLCGYDGSIVRAKMAELKAYSQYQLSETQLLKAQQFFVAYKVSQSETLATIKALAEEGIVCDPHTAVGVAAAKKYTDDRVICLSTAHPAKFPDSVHQAIGILPEKTASIAALEGLPQRCDSLPADVNVIRQYIQEKLQN